MHLYKKIIITSVFFISIFSADTANSSATIDIEYDPIPIVNLMIVAPTGYLSNNSKYYREAHIFDDVFMSGTAKKDRAQFYNALGEFGVEYSFTTSESYTNVNLKFPYIKSKDYSKLIQLIEEQWSSPRFTKKEVSLSKHKLKSSLLSVENSDQALATSVINYWSEKNIFKVPSFFAGDIKKIKLDNIKKYYSNIIRTPQNIWIGFNGPKETLTMSKKIVKVIYPYINTYNEGVMKKNINPSRKKIKATNKKKFFIVEKAGRTQAITAFKIFNSSRISSSDELHYFAGQNIVNGGSNSLFFREIRQKRGLTYYVGSLGRYFYGNPMISAVSNIKTEKAEEGLKVFKDQIERLSKNLLTSMTEKEWKTRTHSYRFKAILGNSSSLDRLMRRKAIVQGIFSYDYYKISPEKWRFDQKESAELFKKIYPNSNQLMAVVGESSKLKALAKKYYADFEVIVVPYNKVLTPSSY